MADPTTPKKKPDPSMLSKFFGGLLGNASLKIQQAQPRTDDAVSRMAAGDDALAIPLYEDDSTATPADPKKKPKK